MISLKKGLFYFYNFIGKWLICSVMLASAVRQGDSVILYIHLFLFRWFSHSVYYRALSKVPCVLQEVLGGYLFYIQEYVCVIFF